MDGGITYIGMDLGTFKTSVVSSNGRREVTTTAMGWAKDHVARTVLGRDMVFGEEALKQRMSLDIIRPFAKGALKYQHHSDTGVTAEQLKKHKEAARLIVEHAVSKTQPPKDQPVYGVIGAPSRASIGNKQAIMDAAEGTFDAVVIVPEPFTVAYGMSRLTNTLVVDIGAGTIDICPMFGMYPREEDQITIPLGGDMVDEAFLELIKEAHPDIRLSSNMARAIKEKHGFVHELDEEAIVTLPVGGRMQQIDVSGPLKKACETIVKPIIEGICDLVSRFDPEFQQGLMKNILLGGGGSQLKGLDRLVEQSLEAYGGANVTKVYDSVFAGSVGALKLAMDMPEDYWQKLQDADAAKPSMASA